MSKPEWAKTLETIAYGLEIRKDMPRISRSHMEVFIRNLREIAAMNLAPLERSGVCETCELEAVRRADTAERKLRLATRLLEMERKTRSASTTDAELAANLLAEVEARERAEFERNEWERLSTGWMDRCNDLIGRVDELESALRKADEIRHEMKEYRDCGRMNKVSDLVYDLKAPCMVLFKRKNIRMSETDCPCNECALEDPSFDIAACRQDVLYRDDGSCDYPEWKAKNDQ